jgi:hypothetical protein
VPYEVADLEPRLPFPAAIVAFLLATVVILLPTCFDIARLDGATGVVEHVEILAKVAVRSFHELAFDDPLQQVLTEDEVADEPYFRGAYVVDSELEG